MKTNEIITQIRTLLTNAGITSFSPMLPQEDIQCVSVSLITGSQNTNLCGSGEYEFLFSVVVRGIKKDDGLTRSYCDDVYEALHNKTTTDIISILGTMPRFIGLDNYERYNYAIVFNAIAKGD